MHDSRTFRVLIGGAGSAALEAAFRLQHVGENRMQATILARNVPATPSGSAARVGLRRLV